MALIEYNLFGKIDKVQNAIDRLKAFEPEEGYEIGDSGGKDSTCKEDTKWAILPLCRSHRKRQTSSSNDCTDTINRPAGINSAWGARSADSWWELCRWGDHFEGVG